MKTAASPLPTGSKPCHGLTVTLPDGRALGYAEYGQAEGLPVLGFHGTPGSRLMFRIANQAAKEAGIRLIAPERPGFGISTYQSSRSLESYARDIAHFVDTLGIERFAVAGVSGGGPYAAACAAFLPSRVFALGLISPIGPMAGPEAPKTLGFGHRAIFRLFPRIPGLLGPIFQIGRLGFLYAPGLIFSFLMSRAAPSDWTILSRAEVRENLLAGVAEGCRPGIAASLQEMRIFSRPWNIPFGQISAPAFLWQGLSDRNVPVPAALRLGALIPNCRTYTVGKAGHYWIFDHIGDVLSAIRKVADGDGGISL